MASVEQGATLTTDNDVFVRATPNGSLVDPDSGTLTLLIKRPDGTALLTVPQSGLTRISQGHFKYDWAVASNLPIGDYPWNWDAKVATVQLPTAVEEVVVVLAGALSTGVLLTPTQFREHITTALPDPALQRLIDANTMAISQRAGAVGSLALVLYPRQSSMLFFDRPIGSIVSLVEFFNDPVGISGVTLDSTDYRIQSGGLILERWGYGTHPADWWSHRVEITYVTVDDTAERRRVLVKLVELDLNRQPGLSGQRIGDYMEQSRNEPYNDEREAILASLVPSALTFA